MESNKTSDENKDGDLNEYRQGLIDTQRKLNESYDKLLVTLSGGALALSIAFLKDVIGSNAIVHPHLLLIAWAFFVISLASILCEILFGIQAHKRAIQQIDDQIIYDEKVGGKSSNWTTRFHWAAAANLIAGLIFISAFAFYNLGASNDEESTNTETTAESTTEAKKVTRP
ncbi:MAG: hypothetical protein ABW140_10700 [Candidatus Sedimenticola sp. 6PFRAG1]